MITEQQIQLKQLEKECLELQIELEKLKKRDIAGTFTYPITYPQNPNITPAFPGGYPWGITYCNGVLPL